MTKNLNKNLTVVIFLGVIFLFSQAVFAVNLTVEDFKTYKRWNIFAPKEQLQIVKKDQKVLIQTLNLETYESLLTEIQKLPLNDKYIQKMGPVGQSDKNSVYQMEMVLTNPSVELFSFYRQRDGKYILDFWIEGEKADKETKVSEVDAAKKPASTAPVAEVKPSIKPVIAEKVVQDKPKLAKPIPVPVAKKADQAPYRDFRYGAPFIWDYEPMEPTLNSNVDLTSKTPEFFYPIKDREISNNDKEAHLQLSINLYRQKKWGLMYKSIGLYQKKYGDTDNYEINEYLKANAILRDNFEKGEREPVKMAIAMFEVLAQKSSNYELKRSIYKYLLSFYHLKKDYVQALQVAKNLYVSSKENFDYEETAVVAEVILYNLSQLNQVDKLKEVIRDKTIIKLVPKQNLLAYQIYVNLRLADNKEVQRLYELSAKGMTDKVLPSILYNTAESYFRDADYDKAVKLFDEFIAQHSYHTDSAKARLRIALSYDLLEKDFLKIRELYKNAYNHSQIAEVRFEAGIRYAAFESVRKRKLGTEERELRVFLDSNNKEKYRNELKELLWIVRLRTFIVDGKYKEALAYLQASSLPTMKPSIKRVFEADGAEIIYGLMKDEYNFGHYAEVIKIWEIYKNKYIDKVANDPYLNFVVGKSYLRLGLMKGFDKIYERLAQVKDTPERSYPIWVDRSMYGDSKVVLHDLDVNRHIMLKNWELADRKLAETIESGINFPKLHFYKAIISFHKKDYKKAIKDFEFYLVEEKSRSMEEPEDVAQLMDYYATSLYEEEQYEQFQKVSQALLKDIENFATKHSYLNDVRERISYLNIELVAQIESNENSLLLEAKIKQFLEKYPKSDYQGRIEFLYGKTLIKNQKVEEGKKLLTGLLGNEGVAGHIKDLVRSELSLLEIKERTIL